MRLFKLYKLTDSQYKLAADTLAKSLLIDLFVNKSTGSVTYISDLHDVLHMTVEFDLESHPWFYEMEGVSDDQKLVQFDIKLFLDTDNDKTIRTIVIQSLNGDWETRVDDFIVVSDIADITSQIIEYLKNAYVTPDKFSFVIHTGIYSAVTKYDMPNASHVTITNRGK